MKKLLFLITAVLFGMAVTAQGSKEEKIVRKSMIAVHLGPTFPVGQFVSHNIPEEGFANIGGYAKAGIMANLNYGYQFHPIVGVTTDVFYSRYNLDKSSIQTHAGEGINADHWQLYGIVIGPMATFKLGNKVTTDLRVMGGAVNANSPEVKIIGELAFNGDWEWAPIFRGGLDFRFDVGKNVYFLLNGDYQYMRPTFTLSTPDGQISEEVKMSMPALNLTGGFGIRF